MGPRQDVLDTLKLAPPLAGLSPDWMEKLVAAARLLRIRAGELVVEHGCAHPGMVILHEGELELSITGHTGRRHVLARLSRGQTFGIVAALDTQPALYTSRACEDSTVVIIPRETLLEAVRANGDFALDLLLDLAGRTRLLYRFVGAQATLPPLGRVANVLLTLMALRGPLADEDGVVDLRFSQTDIADMLGITRQSLGTQLKALQATGAISLQYRGIRVLDVPALMALVAR
jgi:CRP/FNR family cyclic AMP-dependent transcriptional regulator